MTKKLKKAFEEATVFEQMEILEQISKRQKNRKMTKAERERYERLVEEEIKHWAEA